MGVGVLAQPKKAASLPESLTYLFFPSSSVLVEKVLKETENVPCLNFTTRLFPEYSGLLTENISGEGLELEVKVRSDAASGLYLSKRVRPLVKALLKSF